MTETNIDERTSLLSSSSTNNSVNQSDQRTPLKQKVAVYLILFSAALERLAFYSLVGNLTFFLDSHLIQWNFPHTIIVPLIFLGISYISALISSGVSDGKLGRANTILIGFFLYAIGFTFLILFANDRFHEFSCPKQKNDTIIDKSRFFNEPCIEYLLPTLILTAIGVGAVQANMAVFGADQVREYRGKSRYFDVYYAAVNTGGLIAFGAIAYLQINTNYFIGYLVPGGLLGFALLLFLFGYAFYLHSQPQQSVLLQFFPLLCNAFHSWKIQRRQTSDQRATSSFFDYAKSENGGKFSDSIVNDTKSLRRIVAVFLLLIPYWLLYVQVETTFIVQGAHMRLPGSFKAMPVVWLSLGNQIIIIVTIFFLNAFVYKRLRASGRSFSIKSRIIIGMISAAAAMCIAGTVEIFRQEICETQNFTQTIGDKQYLAANMSVFYQFPQYVGIGLSEVFTSVASLEFAYLAAPRSAQSLIMSLRFCSAGLSSLFGSGIVTLLSIENGNESLSTHEDYHNDVRYYIYFFVLAALQLLFVVIFVVCEQNFDLLKLPNLHLNPRRFVQQTISDGDSSTRFHSDSDA